MTFRRASYLGPGRKFSPHDIVSFLYGGTIVNAEVLTYTGNTSTGEPIVQVMVLANGSVVQLRERDLTPLKWS